MKKKKKKKDKSKDGGGDGKGGEGGGSLAFGLDDLFDASGAPAKKKRRVRGPPRPDAAFGETASGMGEGGGAAGTSGTGGGGGGEIGGDASGASSSSPSSASVAAAAALPWAGSDRDYTYAELLDRVFATLRANNPELTGEKRRTLMKPPQVAREGTKKTVFANFAELCKAMNRPGEHVQAFLLAELGTSGNLDGQSRLIVKGRFLPKVRSFSLSLSLSLSFRFSFLFHHFLLRLFFSLTRLYFLLPSLAPRHYHRRSRARCAATSTSTSSATAASRPTRCWTETRAPGSCSSAARPAGPRGRSRRSRPGSWRGRRGGLRSHRAESRTHAHTHTQREK